MGGLHGVPGHTLDALRKMGEAFPVLRAELANPQQRVLMLDILEKHAAGVRNAMTVEEHTAAAMKAGMHVTRGPVTARPMREPGSPHTTGSSREALVSVSEDSQRGLLLSAYGVFMGTGCTDEEAARASGVPMSSCWWKRCGELRASGLITPSTDADGGFEMREGSAGVMRTVCVITPEGEAALSEFSR